MTPRITSHDCRGVGDVACGRARQSFGEVGAWPRHHVRVVAFDMAARSPDGVGVAYKELLMYFPAKHFLDKLQISAQELSDFEQKGIIKGITKAGRVFYSSRDLYRLKGILVLMTRGLTLERAQRRLDHPVEETSGTESRR